VKDGFDFLGQNVRRYPDGKTIGLLRKLRHRGLLKVDWVFIFTALAYNLVRIRNLQPAA
jgi:hypothetical protein